METHPPRLLALDLLRGLALLGIMVNHVFYLSAHPFAAALQDYHAIAFFMLSGIVFTYAAKQEALPNVIRGIVCIVLGLILAAGNPPVDLILVNYGIMFLVAAFTVHRMSTRLLGIVGVTLLFIAPVVSQVLRVWLGMGSQGENQSSSLEQVLGVALRPLFYGHYPLLQWSAVFFLGAYVGRKLRAGQQFTWLRLVCAGSLAFIVAKGISLLGSSFSGLFTMGDGNVDLGWEHLLDSYAYSGTTLGLAASMAVVITLWGLLELCYQQLPVVTRATSEWVVMLGQATLTVYVCHVLVILFADIPKDFWWGVVYYVVQVSVFVLLLRAWRKFKMPSRGPLEAVTEFIVRVEKNKSRS